MLSRRGRKLKWQAADPHSISQREVLAEDSVGNACITRTIYGKAEFDEFKENWLWKVDQKILSIFDVNAGLDRNSARFVVG